MAESNIKRNISIIEEGTSGIWTYRKYSDGTAECWGNYVYNNLPINNPYGYGYYSAEINVNFPTGLFISNPSIQATSGDVAGYGSWFNITTNGTSQTKVRGMMYSITSVTVTVSIAFHAIGKWK